MEKKIKKVPLSLPIFFVIFLILGLVAFLLMSSAITKPLAKDEYPVKAGTIFSVKEEYIGDDKWTIIRLNNDDNLYRIIPYTKNVIAIKDLKQQLVVNTEVNLAVTSFKNYSDVFNVMGITTFTEVILDIDKMINEQHLSNRDLLISAFIIMILCEAVACFFLFHIIFFATKTIVNQYGRLKIKYHYNNHIIEIYNAPTTLSLLIDGVVVNSLKQLVASNQTITAIIDNDNYPALILLKLNCFGTLKLYINNKLVAKKRCPFG